MCTAYDSHNAWLQVYINGVLYGERSTNMYDHLTGVSNQWGNMIDVYEPDLYVGKAPRHQHSSDHTGRYTNILGDADEKGHDFVGEFTMVGVWNNYVMTEAEAARMAGIQDAAAPRMTVGKVPVHTPTAFAMTPREAAGVTDAGQPRLAAPTTRRLLRRCRRTKSRTAGKPAPARRARRRAWPSPSQRGATAPRRRRPAPPPPPRWRRCPQPAPPLPRSGSPPRRCDAPTPSTTSASPRVPDVATAGRDYFHNP